jgi:hypothetical protein
MPNNATYCAWVKMDAGSGGVVGLAGTDQYALKINAGNQVAVRNDADNETMTWAISSIYGSWHHMCLTQTDNLVSYSLALYVDGTSSGSPQVMTNGVTQFDSIGQANGSFFDGGIDDVRIYNRTLTPTEIGRLASGEEPATYTSTQTLSSNLDVNGNLYLASGRLDVSGSNYSVNIGGDLRTDGGVFNTQSGAVVLDGADQSINSSMTFYDLSKSVSSAATLTFGKDSTTAVTHQLNCLMPTRSTSCATAFRLITIAISVRPKSTTPRRWPLRVRAALPSGK